MKKSTFTLITLGLAALLYSAAAQTPPVAPDDNNNAAPDQAGPPDAGAPPTVLLVPDLGTPDQAGPDNGPRNPTVLLPSKRLGASETTVPQSFTPPSAPGTNSDAIMLNFNNAPLAEVLGYLSDAAGFIIVLETTVRGNVSIISKHPMTRDEAVDLLNSSLNQNGFAAIRNGRTLTIMDKNDAKTGHIPVNIGNDPTNVLDNAEIVTQIIPIRFVTAGDLVKDLSSFVSPQATVVANEDGNSIIITDTQSNIRHLIEIIKAIDDSAEAETQIRVFKLAHANPSDVASELSSVFPNSTSGNNAQAPTRVAGFGGGGGGGRRGGGGFGAAAGGNPFAALFGGGAGAGNSSADRIKKETQVSVVADLRISAVIVTAPKDLMDQIEMMMTQLDVPSDRDADVHVFPTVNGDPQQIAQVLQNMFQSSTSTRGNTTTSQNSELQQRRINAATQQSSMSTTTYGAGTAGGAGGL